MIYYVEDDTNIRDLTVYALKQAGIRGGGLPGGGRVLRRVQGAPPRVGAARHHAAGNRRARDPPYAAREPGDQASARDDAHGKGTEFDTVSGLDAGADDYLAKPFGMMELVSRVNALMRRASAPPVMADDELSCGPIELCVSAHTVQVGGEPITLTLKEFDLLHTLLQNQGARAVAQPTAGRRVGYDVRGGDAHGGCARADAAPEAGRGARRGRRPRSYGARRGLLHQTLLVSARMSPTHFKVKSLSGKIFTSVLAFTLARHRCAVRDDDHHLLPVLRARR